MKVVVLSGAMGLRTRGSLSWFGIELASVKEALTSVQMLWCYGSGVVCASHEMHMITLQCDCFVCGV